MRYFPREAGDAEGLQYRPVVERGLRLTSPTRSSQLGSCESYPQAPANTMQAKTLSADSAAAWKATCLKRPRARTRTARLDPQQNGTDTGAIRVVKDGVARVGRVFVALINDVVRQA